MLKKIVHTVILLAEASEIYFLIVIAVVSLIKN